VRSKNVVLDLRITSADLTHSIEKIRLTEIAIYNLRVEDEMTARFEVSPFDYKKLRNISVQNQFDLQICNRIGYLWTIRQMLHRKVLIIACMLLLIFTLAVPGRVLFVNVEGNKDVETAKIKEAAEKAGIHLGVARRHVRSEKVKNSLLELLPELQWVGVTTNGCVANVAVKEKSEASKVEENVSTEKIVANRDGIILSCNATKGNLLCSVGQTVTAGETLVSGYIDCGRWIRKTGAEGEIYARTRRTLELIFPAQWICKQQCISVENRYSIIIGKKRINLWKDSGISDVTYDRIYKEYYTFLPGGFQVPVALAIESCYQRDTEKQMVEKDKMFDRLNEYADAYLRTQMIAGGIQTKQVTLVTHGDVLCLTGEYSCTEMIGRVQQEEIGDEYE